MVLNQPCPRDPFGTVRAAEVKSRFFNARIHSRDSGTTWETDCKRSEGRRRSFVPDIHRHDSHDPRLHGNRVSGLLLPKLQSIEDKRNSKPIVFPILYRSSESSGKPCRKAAIRGLKFCRHVILIDALSRRKVPQLQAVSSLLLSHSPLFLSSSKKTAISCNPPA
jgi:hypothetical protein